MVLLRGNSLPICCLRPMPVIPATSNSIEAILGHLTLELSGGEAVRLERVVRHTLLAA
jgi:hypothetical protein